MTRAGTKRAVLLTVCATAVLCAVFAFGVRPSHAEEINQRKLEYEFARFVQGRLDSEPEVRAALSGFVKQNRAKFSEGLGMHPELVPPMMEAAGLAKMNCISGRYFPALEKGLDKDGFSFFYGVKEELDHWVTMVAVEEAVREKVYSPSPPLNYRRRSDFPPFIALALREVIRPYLREGPGLGPGVGFDGLTCE